MAQQDRRSFLRSLLALPAVAYGATEVDWEQLLWTPKTIITVPAMPSRRVLLTLEDLNRTAIQAIGCRTRFSSRRRCWHISGIRVLRYTVDVNW